MLTWCGCASTQIKASWKDPTYSMSAMRKVLVMAVVPQSTSQRVMEDAFVDKLSKQGVQALASYSLSPSEAGLNEEGWKRLVAENNVDTILVVRLVDMKTVEREVPPSSTMVNSTTPSYPANYHGGYSGNRPAYGTGWYGYYENSYQVVTTPGYTIKDTYAIAETKLWDIQNGKLVWTGSTHTQVIPDQSTEAVLRQYAGVIVTAMYKK